MLIWIDIKGHVRYIFHDNIFYLNAPSICSSRPLSHFRTQCGPQAKTFVHPLSLRLKQKKNVRFFLAAWVVVPKYVSLPDLNEGCLAASLFSETSKPFGEGCTCVCVCKCSRVWLDGWSCRVCVCTPCVSRVSGRRLQAAGAAASELGRDPLHCRPPSLNKTRGAGFKTCQLIFWPKSFVFFLLKYPVILHLRRKGIKDVYWLV